MKQLIRIISFFLLVCSLHAQKVLTLEECVQIALKNNHDLKQTIFDYNIAEEQVSEAYGTSLFPSINGSANYTRAIERPVFIFEVFGETQRIVMGTANSMTASLDLEQPLFTGAMFLATEIAETFAELSKKAVDYSEEEVVKKVKESYYTYILSGEFVKLADYQLERAELNMNNTKALYEAGLVPEYDLIQATVQYKNLIPARSKAINQTKQAKNNVILLMGLDLNEDVTISDSLTLNELEIPEFEQGLKFTFENNKLVKQSEIDTELKDLVASYEFTEHLPKLTGFGNLQSQAQEEDDRSVGSWRFRNAISVGLMLKVPIFKGFSIDSRVEQAKIDHKKSLEGLAKTRFEIKNQYENIYLEINSLVEQIDAYKSSVEEAERGYEIAVKSYNSGLATQLEVTNSLVEVISASVNFLTSLHDYYVAHANLDFVMGKNINQMQY